MNTSSLTTYLIEQECIFLEERHKINSGSKREDVMQLMEMISRKGDSGFKAFLRALERSAEEDREQSHADLALILKEAYRNHLMRSVSNSTSEYTTKQLSILEVQ